MTISAAVKAPAFSALAHIANAPLPVMLQLYSSAHDNHQCFVNGVDITEQVWNLEINRDEPHNQFVATFSVGYGTTEMATITVPVFFGPPPDAT